MSTARFELPDPPTEDPRAIRDAANDHLQAEAEQAIRDALKTGEVYDHAERLVIYDPVAAAELLERFLQPLNDQPESQFLEARAALAVKLESSCFDSLREDAA